MLYARPESLYDRPYYIIAQINPSRRKTANKFRAILKSAEVQSFMERTGPNLVMRRKFIQFLFPTLAIMAMSPVGQIVESVVLARAVGIQAMALSSLVSPFLLFATAVYYFIGSGGVAEYTLALNEGDEGRAGSSFRLTILLAGLCGALLTGILLVFFDPLCHLLCRMPAYDTLFRSYFRIEIFSIIPLILFLTLTEMLIPMGKPGFALISVLIVEISHILLTTFYVALFRLSLEGAAAARLGSYLTGLLVTACGVFIYAPQTRPVRERHFFRHLPGRIASIILRGNSEGISVGTRGFRFLWTFCIGAATIGTNAVAAFSVCTLMASVDSIIQGTLIGTSMPLIALLHEQADYRSAGRILWKTMVYQFLLSAFWFLVSILLARPIIQFFGIRDETQIRMAVSALRIYSLSYLFRGSYTLFRNYLKILHLRKHAWILTTVAMAMNLVYIGCSFLGGDALWWAHPVLSLGLLVFTVAGNRAVVRRSEGKWHGILLIPREQKTLQTLNASIELSREEISRFGEKLQTLCEQNKLDPRRAAVCAVAVEELLLNVLEKEEGKDYADVFVRIYANRVEIDFRTLGAAFQPDEMALLRRISPNISHRNIGNMNCTRLILSGKAGKTV